MTKILTAMTFAIALGLSMATASAEGGKAALHDPSLPIFSQQGLPAPADNV